MSSVTGTHHSSTEQCHRQMGDVLISSRRHLHIFCEQEGDALLIPLVSVHDVRMWTGFAININLAIAYTHIALISKKEMYI